MAGAALVGARWRSAPLQNSIFAGVLGRVLPDFS